jgi:hypothetical protein
MQLQTELAQFLLYQAIEHDLQGGHLFCNEEDGLSAADSRGNEVSNRLRLARARRALNAGFMAAYLGNANPLLS